MFRKWTWSLIALFSFGSPLVFAQDAWSLERCIQFAQQNSLTIKQAQNAIKNAEWGLKQNQFNRLPSLSGGSSFGYQFGRTIDPVTNDFNNEKIGFNSYSLSGGILLYNGNQINNSIKQSRFDLEAFKLDAQSSSDDIALNVAGAYLNILLAEEQLQNARIRLELSRQQLDQTDKLIQAGTLPENDRLDFLARIALDEQAVIDAENAVAINYLTLKQLMDLDPQEDIVIEKPEVEIPEGIDPDNFSLNAIYNKAVQIQPQILAGNMRLESSALGIQLAKGGMFPSLRLFGGLSTNYSTLGKTVSGQRTVTQSQTVIINGDPVTFEFQNEIPVIVDNPFWDQLSENFGQNVGLSLNIPIYSNHSNRIGMERARLGLLNTEVQNQQIRQQFKTNIQRAIADARSAKRLLEASRRSVEASRIAYENAQKRFDLGTINSLEYSTARNNYDQAQIDLIRARYQYVFNILVVKFYEERNIQLR